jgi:dipeptidyl aminopeptidase/acylaminoacyl peptidase
MKPKAWMQLSALVIITLVGSLAQAEDELDRAIRSLAAVREFQQTAISPDGSRVAWVESLLGELDAPTPNSAIYVSAVKPPSAPHRISAAGTACEESSVAWSPDSKRLAFLSDAAAPGQLQLYVMVTPDGAAQRLTNLKGFLADPKWSPDGKSIAFLFTENAPRAAGPLEPMTPPSGDIEQQIYEQRLAIVDASTGNVKLVSPADLYVYEYDWSPDGSSFAATAAHGDGDDNWYIAELYTLDLSTGRMRSIYKPSLQIGVPRWSPDGKEIAFIGGLMSDEPSIGGDIFVIPAVGGEARNLTPEIKSSPGSLIWFQDSAQILFGAQVHGESELARVDVARGTIMPVWRGSESITSGDWSVSVSVARDGGTSAVIRDSFAHPPEVWAGPLGEWTEITHANRDAHPSWGEARSIHWTNEGYKIQGWLLYPREYDPKQHYPMVVVVHGGPGSMERSSWPKTFYNTSLLSAEGYFVLYPNPRGSFGQGEAFTRANVKDFGYGDLRDVLAGVDEVVKTLPVDDHRVGLTGWSYGGFMTMWAVTQTNRFRAAVAGAGIANWLSYYGENDLDQWMIPFFGASVYDDPAVYAKSSAIDYVKKVKTPTLVVVGDRDGECPAPQSFEFWHALKAQGVETKLVVYANEGHHIHMPEHRQDIIRRQIAWFNEHMHF